jgi:hypothetical protein
MFLNETIKIHVKVLHFLPIEHATINMGFHAINNP